MRIFAAESVEINKNRILPLGFQNEFILESKNDIIPLNYLQIATINTFCDIRII
jgi:arginine exporter protein ArgO